MSQKNLFCFIRRIITMLISRFNILQSFNYTPFLFYKKRFKSEIISFWLCTLSWNFKESMGAINRGGIGLSYRPARLHRLAEFIPWN
jgi:hypothetical protein